MLRILEVILIGIVEGITEWLPISSTGHMILLYELFHIDPQDPFWSMFLVVIQFGAILAVIVLFFRRLWPFRMPDPQLQGGQKVLSVIKVPKIIMWLKILVSCVPAAVVGLTVDDWIEEHLYNYIVVALMLIIYGILFILIETRNRGRRAEVRSISQISWPLAILIGVFQALAIIPGTSRSGATILGGLLLGMTRKCASEYTFFLAIPTMFGASLLKIVKFSGSLTGMQIFYLVLGMVIAFATSIAAIRFLMEYIRRHDFKKFGYYRIVLGAFVLLFFAIRSLLA
ncbi:MAG: undecaprenyl-diphosphate phosphatase [Lachnospiraceae bacterium]|nr:undecaprenyl-diphosphate phosphatase [Lachnospiraceae bacterium]